ncbi:MAG: hypothetical protein LBN40_04700 [Oscillospiraceae bacterium]|jgi:hypothetical protein|nr:hypothetical protein [Oscillospiraceae bacterium]
MANFEETLSEVQEIVDGAPGIPFSDNCIINRGRMQELLHTARIHLPDEMKQASSVVSRRGIILKEAEDKSADILRRTEEQVKRMTEAHVITAQAQEYARHITADAQEKSRDILGGTYKFVEDTLAKLNDILAADMVEVKKTLSVLKDRTSQQVKEINNAGKK